jgi:uncharacterized membrane protein
MTFLTDAQAETIAGGGLILIQGPLTSPRQAPTITIAPSINIVTVVAPQIQIAVVAGIMKFKPIIIQKTSFSLSMG